MLGLAERVAEKIGVPGTVGAADVEADCDYVGEVYGIPGKDTVKAIRMFAELEGLLLDFSASDWSENELNPMLS